MCTFQIAINVAYYINNTTINVAFRYSPLNTVAL